MRYILLLGGNIGDVDTTMDEAARKMLALGEIRQTSSTYESIAWGFESERRFRNRVVELSSKMDPFSLLERLQEIERELGRTEKTQKPEKYSDRTIDIDILFCDRDVIQTPTLTIPHPRLHKRMFTLKPLMEHWSDMMHPLLMKTVRELHDECTDEGFVRRVTQ